ncbi:MAG: DUF3189 family protein, partial [Candidatus Saccharibacteria bacterium]
MIIIYHCFGGSHSSVTAASIHLGLLNSARVPTKAELMNLPYFDKTPKNDWGSIRPMGIDDKGNMVYVMGKKNLGDRLDQMLMGIAKLAGVQNNVKVVNTVQCVNWLMMLGGFTSRRLRIVKVGRPIVLFGTQKAFYSIARLVNKVKASI